MNTPKISVIMPMYGVEKTLDKAVKSILTQSLMDWELILVDDQSPDASGTMADGYAKEDGRIRVVHKEKNEGLAQARNTGCDYARGEYIIFMDSDDWVEPHMLSDVWETAQTHEADVVVFGYCQDTVREGMDPVTTASVSATPQLLQSREEIVAYVSQLDREKVFAYAWNKAYRRSIVEASGVRARTVTLIEDILYNAEIFGYFNTMAVIPGVYYHYMKYGSGALTDKFVESYPQLICQRFDSMKRLYESADVYRDTVRQELCSVHLRHVIAAFERECAGPFSFGQRHARMKALMKTPQTKEALRFARGTSKQAKLLNGVLKVRSTLGGMAFGRLLYTVKHKNPKLFDKLK